MSIFSRRRPPEGVDPGRIPPGQTLTAPDRWPVLTFGPVPRTDTADWDLKVFGLVGHELKLTYDELRALGPRLIRFVERNYVTDDGLFYRPAESRPGKIDGAQRPSP